jgi:hypothetical protein
MHFAFFIDNLPHKFDSVSLFCLHYKHINVNKININIVYMNTYPIMRDDKVDLIA